MGPEGLQELETLGLLHLLPRHALPGHHLPLPDAAPASVFHRQRHHSLHALLLPHRAGLLPAYGLWYGDPPGFRVLQTQLHPVTFIHSHVEVSTRVHRV